MAKIISVKEAAELVKDGAVIGSAVQGMAGWPEEIGIAIEKRFLETSGRHYPYPRGGTGRLWPHVTGREDLQGRVRSGP